MSDSRVGSGSGSGSGSGRPAADAEVEVGYEPPLFLPPWLESPLAHLWRTCQETAWLREQTAAGRAGGSGSGSGPDVADGVLHADFVGGPALTVPPGEPVYLLARVRGGRGPYTLTWTVTHELDGETVVYPQPRPTVWGRRAGVYAVALRVRDADGRGLTVAKASYLWVKVAV